MVSSGYQVALMQNFQPDYLKLIHLELTNQMIMLSGSFMYRSISIYRSLVVCCFLRGIFI